MKKKIVLLLIAVMMVAVGALTACQTKYKVTFDADGGTPVPAAVSVVSGEKITDEITDPEKNGYIFWGWYNGENKFDLENDTVTSDITLKAKWGVTVTFDADGGTPVPAEQKIIVGGKVTKPADPDKNNFVFKGWYNGDTAFNFENDTVSAGIMLKAKYNAKVTATFDADGGTPVPAEQIVETGTKLTKPADPARGELIFMGWFIGETKFDFDKDTIAENSTLKAKWGVTMSFDTNGGSEAPESQPVIIGGKAVKPEDPTKDDYTFGGWYNGEAEFDFEEDTIEEDTTLTAKWNISFAKVAGDWYGEKDFSGYVIKYWITLNADGTGSAKYSMSDMDTVLEDAIFKADGDKVIIDYEMYPGTRDTVILTYDIETDTFIVTKGIFGPTENTPLERDTGEETE